MEISIFIVLIVLILVLIYLYQGKSNGIILYEEYLDITGMYGLLVNYRNIFQIDLISEMPEIGIRTNGYYFRSVCKGYFIVKDFGDAYLNLNLKYPPYIRIILKNDTCIFINLNVEKDTTELFENLVHRTLKNK